MVPLMVTLPVARRIAGVFAAFRVKVTVTPEGILTVVKLNTPVGGRARMVLLAGLNGPSAPVLPLLNVCPSVGVPVNPRRAAPRRTPPRYRLLCWFMWSLHRCNSAFRNPHVGLLATVSP
jgi:hypothetical protein